MELAGNSSMRRRKRIATIVMLLSLIGSGTILGVGRIKYAWATRRLAALQAQCLSSAREPSSTPAAASPLKPGETEVPIPPGYKIVKRGQKPGSELPPPPRGYKIDPGDFVPAPKTLTDRDFVPDVLANSALVCDPSDLSDLQNSHGDLNGIALEIAYQFDAREKTWDATWDAAWFLAVLLSLPFAWYFLLARIAELAESIRGDRGPRS
jgi:hypothetical protein